MEKIWIFQVIPDVKKRSRYSQVFPNFPGVLATLGGVDVTLKVSLSSKHISNKPFSSFEHIYSKNSTQPQN